MIEQDLFLLVYVALFWRQNLATIDVSGELYEHTLSKMSKLCSTLYRENATTCYNLNNDFCQNFKELIQSFKHPVRNATAMTKHNLKH